MRITDLAVVTDVISGQTFENCLIVGPAIVALQGCTVNTCEFVGDLDAILWPTYERSYLIGDIALTDCNFVGCRFERVGFAGPPPFIDWLSGALGV